MDITYYTNDGSQISLPIEVDLTDPMYDETTLRIRRHFIQFELTGAVKVYNRCILQRKTGTAEVLAMAKQMRKQLTAHLQEIDNILCK